MNQPNRRMMLSSQDKERMCYLIDTGFLHNSVLQVCRFHLRSRILVYMNTSLPIRQPILHFLDNFGINLYLEHKITSLYKKLSNHKSFNRFMNRIWWPLTNPDRSIRSWRVSCYFHLYIGLFQCSFRLQALELSHFCKDNTFVCTFRRL